MSLGVRFFRIFPLVLLFSVLIVNSKFFIIVCEKLII